MCKANSDDLETILCPAAVNTATAVLTRATMATTPSHSHAQSPAPPERPHGSRRRRLWELEGRAHCCVIGVCLPIAALRRLVSKVLGGQPVADDYELHCAVINECKLRTAVADAAQRELDRRYAPALRQAANAKTTDALAAWWDDTMRCHDTAGALWSTLTHPRCDTVLAGRVLGEVHMLQHQAGMAARVDLGRFEALLEENGVVARGLAAAQQRSTRQAAEHARRTDDQQTLIMQLRGQLMARDTTIACLRDALRTLEASVPDLKTRFEMGRENQRQAERIHDLERTALHAEQEAERQRRRAGELAIKLQHRDTLAVETAEPHAPVEPQPRLDAQAVLCIGGRTASVPLYRHIVEKVGGRFLHHDGGEEESSARLDATLAAADLVICQTGCISHNAYWRVKDHCKRTGKRCVFVETPSSAGIKRALIALAPTRVADPLLTQS